MTSKKRNQIALACGIPLGVVLGVAILSSGPQESPEERPGSATPVRSAPTWTAPAVRDGDQEPPAPEGQAEPPRPVAPPDPFHPHHPARDFAKQGVQPQPAPAGEAPQPADGFGPEGPDLVHNSVVAGLDDLVRVADRIVVGRIVGSTARWNRRRTMIYTFYTVEVQHTLKGAHKERVQLRVIGGSIPGEEREIHVTHQPKLSKGAVGIVFINDDPRVYTSVVGAHQGFLELEDNGPRKAFTVKDGFGRPIYGLTRTDRFAVRGAPASSRITDGEILTRIRKLVG